MPASQYGIDLSEITNQMLQMGQMKQQSDLRQIQMQQAQMQLKAQAAAQQMKLQDSGFLQGATDPNTGIVDLERYEQFHTAAGNSADALAIRKLRSEAAKSAAATKKDQLANLAAGYSLLGDISFRLESNLAAGDQQSFQQGFAEGSAIAEKFGIPGWDQYPQDVAQAQSFLEGFRKQGGANREALMKQMEIDSKTEKTGETKNKRKRDEMIRLGIDEHVATGAAYGLYQQVTDPETGDIFLMDLRNNAPASPGVTQQVLDSNVVTDAVDETITKNITKPAVIAKGVKKQEIVSNELQGIKDDLMRSKVGEIEGTLTAIEKMVQPMLAGNLDIPGHGATAALPDFMITQQGQFLRQETQKLSNMVLSERSGATVTDPEERRLLTELGAGNWKTDAQLIQGLKVARRAIETTKLNIASAYGDESIASWNKNAGTKLSREAMRSPLDLYFSSEEAAVNAQLPKGTQVYINGRRAIIE